MDSEAPPPGIDLLSVREAAHRYGLNWYWLMDQVRSRVLPSWKVEGELVVSVDMVEQLSLFIAKEELRADRRRLLIMVASLLGVLILLVFILGFAVMGQVAIVVLSAITGVVGLGLLWRAASVRVMQETLPGADWGRGEDAPRFVPAVVLLVTAIVLVVVWASWV